MFPEAEPGCRFLCLWPMLLIADRPSLTQACRSECASIRDRHSSLQQHLSLLTSNLCRRRREASSFLCATGLLAGALRHAHDCLSMLRQQKAHLSRWLAGKEVLEEEVRRLATALGGEEAEGGRRRALRRWRRVVWVLLAAYRWRELTRQTTVLFQVEVGRGGATVGVCGGLLTQRDETSARAGQ